MNKAERQLDQRQKLSFMSQQMLVESVKSEDYLECKERALQECFLKLNLSLNNNIVKESVWRITDGSTFAFQ